MESFEIIGKWNGIVISQGVTKGISEEPYKMRCCDIAHILVTLCADVLFFSELWEYTP